MPNQNIIPYVPIAPRVQCKNHKSNLLCQQLFTLIDHCFSSQFSFNHDTQKGHISISPDQINDLLLELSKSEHPTKSIDIDILKQSLNDLIYPKFNGEHTITSPIWNNSDIRVWQFQLNQIATGVDMQTNYNDAELNLDQVLSSIRIWRKSLEIGSENPDVIYKQNDLIYKLMDLEQKLDLVQEYLEH